MASLYITEYRRFGRDDRGSMIPAGQEPAITTQKLTIASSAAPSAPFDAECRIVELHCDAACHVKFNLIKGPTAATNSHKRLPSGATQFFAVQPGHMVSVIEGV